MVLKRLKELNLRIRWFKSIDVLSEPLCVEQRQFRRQLHGKLHGNLLLRIVCCQVQLMSKLSPEHGGNSIDALPVGAQLCAERFIPFNLLEEVLHRQLACMHLIYELRQRSRNRRLFSIGSGSLPYNLKLFHFIN